MIGCIIATMIFIFAAAWLLSLVSLVILPLVIYTSYFYLKSYQGRNDEYKQIYSSAASFSEQSFFSIKTVKQMNA
jgi:ABC-type bacteriocin/lantibiotic exporter with double-glycine peptidase domain